MQLHAAAIFSHFFKIKVLRYRTQRWLEQIPLGALSKSKFWEDPVEDTIHGLWVAELDHWK